ncbi:hypothetical protein ANN_23312 [Periplaneta americana]|uniref:Uncharacterized protein n=1 Tax=Periplaneta americana TaxID=6978 RepID=A0ABQ8SKU6_PERAM|nr:hypothetical protein ANN_23312 [Periplaneta americana]
MRCTIPSRTPMPSNLTTSSSCQTLSNARSMSSICRFLSNLSRYINPQRSVYKAIEIYGKVANAMSRDRFKLIMANFHACNNEEIDAADKFAKEEVAPVRTQHYIKSMTFASRKKAILSRLRTSHNLRDIAQVVGDHRLTKYATGIRNRAETSNVVKCSLLDVMKDSGRNRFLRASVASHSDKICVMSRLYRKEDIFSPPLR